MTQTLVTGGSGFIGQHLVAALLAQGRQVRVLDLHSPACPTDGVKYFKGSILNSDLVRTAMAGVEEVYHLAALPGMWVPRRETFYAVNCQGTGIVLAAAGETGVSRMLHCSTESILFGPSSTEAFASESVCPGLDEMPGVYTRSKKLAEQLALEAATPELEVVIANPTMPIGPRDHNITPPSMMLRHFLNRRVQFYLDFVMNLVDVRDVAKGLLLAMERGRNGQRYILGGENISLRTLLQRMDAIIGRTSLRLQIPGKIAQVAAATMEFMADRVTQRRPAATIEGVRIALRAKPVSIERAWRELGYEPGSIEPVLRETVTSILGRF